MRTGRPDLRFPRSSRLRARPDFLKIQEGGSRARGRFIILLSLPNQSAETRFGVTVSRRVGSAVVRNRVRRRLREAMRLSRSRFAGGQDIVSVALPSSAQATYREMETELLALARKLKAVVTEALP